MGYDRLLKILKENDSTFSDGIYMPKEVLGGEFKVIENDLMAAFKSGDVIKVYSPPTENMPGYFGVSTAQGCVHTISEPKEFMGFTLADIDLPAEVLYGFIRPLYTAKQIAERASGKPKKEPGDSPRKRVMAAQNAAGNAMPDPENYEAKILALGRDAKSGMRPSEIRSKISELSLEIGMPAVYRKMLEDYGIKKEHYEKIMQIDLKKLAPKWQEWDLF